MRTDSSSPAVSAPVSTPGAPANASPLAGLPTDAWLKLDNQLCFALYSASLTMTKAYKPLLARFGLTYPQYLVLLVLWEKDGQAVSEIGAKLYLDSGTLTPLLKRLEALEFIRRDRDPADERRVVVSLTTGGKRLQKRALALPEHISCAMGCTLPQLVALTRQLTSLRATLEQSLTESP